MNEFQIREEILRICRQLHQRNLLAAADGNVSFRISNDRILITPRGKNKEFIQLDDISVITLDNQILSGDPSSERLMHLSVYKHCPKAQAVVHAHPPTAIAWSISHPHLKELPFDSLPEVILAVGRIPIVDYARPSTQEMGDHLIPHLNQSRVMILSRHGGLSWGESLIEAYNGIERLEHSSQILMHAKILGRLSKLPGEEIEALKSIRKSSGNRTL